MAELKERRREKHPLSLALSNRQPRDRLIFHLDRRAESPDRRRARTLACCSMRQRATRPGHMHDNVHIESLNNILKALTCHHQIFKSDEALDEEAR